MKTKGFVKSVEELGFRVRTHDYIDGRKDFRILRKESYFTAATVSENRKNIFNTDTSDFFKLSQEKQDALFDLLVEYASTLIEEREEEKRYRIRHKYLSVSWEYLNHVAGGRWLFSERIGFPGTKTQFTLSELPNWVNEMLEQGHLIKEEVE